MTRAVRHAVIASLTALLFGTTGSLAQVTTEVIPTDDSGEVVVAVPTDPNAETFVINLRDTKITIFAEQVSAITGRTLILDPQLAGEITVVSSKPLDREGVWALFQSSLRVRGFAAVQSGDIWQVIPEEQARSNAQTGPLALSGGQDTVTRVLVLDRLAAAEAVRVLRPLVAQSGYIEALADPNSIVVTDTAENVERIIEIARTFDTQDEQRAQVISFRYADAGTVGQAIVQVLGEGAGARLSVDPGSNTLLVRGPADDVAEIRRLAAALDVAPRPTQEIAIGTRVIRLQYADAEVLAEIARNTLSGRTELTNPVAQSVGAGEQTPDGVFRPGGPASAPLPDVSIQASTEQNAIIVRGTARQLDEVSALIQSLDQRRAQVLIEAAIVEVSGEVADRLGVQFGFGADSSWRGDIKFRGPFGEGGESLGDKLFRCRGVEIPTNGQYARTGLENLPVICGDLRHRGVFNDAQVALRDHPPRGLRKESVPEEFPQLVEPVFLDALKVSDGQRTDDFQFLFGKGWAEHYVGEYIQGAVELPAQHRALPKEGVVSADCADASACGVEKGRDLFGGKLPGPACGEVHHQRAQT
ncbi:hypothetical protein LCGC14_2077630, partial [marine sediment metagenome]